jgi:hypothetical protein
MNKDILLSFGRQILMAVGATAVTKGYVSADNMQLILGGMCAVVSSVLSYNTHKAK